MQHTCSACPPTPLPPPRVGYHAEFHYCWLNGANVLIRRKKNRALGSLELIGGRSIGYIYDIFLLVVHIVTICPSCTVLRYSEKIANFYYYFCYYLTPLRILHLRMSSTTRMARYHEEKKSYDIFSRFDGTPENASTGKRKYRPQGWKSQVWKRKVQVAKLENASTFH